MMSLNQCVQQRDQEIARQVAQEMKENQAEREQERAVGGDAVAVDGTILFTGRRDHPYHGYNCQTLVHNLCAQNNGLCSDDNELDMYCSEQ